MCSSTAYVGFYEEFLLIFSFMENGYGTQQAFYQLSSFLFFDSA